MYLSQSGSPGWVIIEWMREMILDLLFWFPFKVWKLQCKKPGVCQASYGVGMDCGK